VPPRARAFCLVQSLHVRHFGTPPSHESLRSEEKVQSATVADTFLPYIPARLAVLPPHQAKERSLRSSVSSRAVKRLTF